MRQTQEDAFIIPFRYSNRLVNYGVWFSGWVIWGAAVFFYGERFMAAIGIRSATDSPFYDTYGTAGFVGLLAGILLSFVLAFVLPFLLARKITDKHGKAVFTQNYVEIRRGFRVHRLAYTDIKSLTWRTVLNAQHGGNGCGPMLYRLHIRHRRGKYILPASFKEAWECKKADDAPPQLWPICQELAQRTGLPVRDKKR